MNSKKKLGFLSQIIFVVFVFLVWQTLYNADIWPKILFPSPIDVFNSIIYAFLSKSFGNIIVYSMGLLARGLMLGIIVAMLFSGLALSNIPFYYVYNLLVSVFDLIPGIALIPVAILWLGIGDKAIIFMVFHSVVWPLSRSILDGFNAVPKLYIEVGRNLGLSEIGIITGVYFPAALQRIFSGIKVGWARAWRGLISAEMVFGGGSALGIGYYITDRRTNLDIAGIFAAICVIIFIGIIVEYGVFRTIENKTFKKWGMIH